MKHHDISEGERHQQRHQLMLLDQHIHALVDGQKNLVNDIKVNRASLQRAKKDLKSVRAKKKKIDLPIFLGLKTFSRSIISQLQHTMVVN